MAYDGHAGPLTSNNTGAPSERVTHEKGAADACHTHLSSGPPRFARLGPLTAWPRVDDPKSDHYGLALLYTPAGKYEADIIFIHGLDGSSKGTWCKNRRLDTFWPQQWLPNDPDLRRCRVHSFGYNAKFRSPTQSSSLLGIAHFANELLVGMFFSALGLLNLGEVGSTP